AAIIPLAHFPLTSSGKLDRKKLPDPGKPVSGNYTPPRNQIEKQLTGIWMSILQRDETSTPIGIDDNFFELGGHSLLAAVMVSRIHKELDVKITLTDIFTYGNIRSLAGHIKNTPLYRYAAIESIEKQEYYPLSSAQKQMYVLQRLADTGMMYNIPMIIQLQGVLSREKTNDIFRQLIQRHENLRTSFHWLNDQPVQRVHDGIDFNLEYDTVENPVETKAFVVRKIKDFIRPFDLAKIPLFRAGLIKLAEQEYLLMIDIHHIISDGVSVMILNREFMSLYFGKELPGLRIQYKDYAHWHNLVLISGELAKQEAFWLKQFSSGVPRLNLPTDYNRPPVQVFKGEHLSFEIEKDLTAALKNLALSRGTTLYMVLLSAVAILLAKLSGQDDIVLGLTTAGRRHADLEPVIGNFITTLACRNYPQPTKTYSAFLEEVKKNTLAAFENQDYPFEYLVGKIPHRDKSRNPMFDVMFGLLNFKELSGEIPEAPEGHLKAVPGPYSFENKTAKMDMLWLAQERDEDLYVMVEFCTELFKRESVEKFIRYFQEIITGILKEPAQKISEISILSAAEKNKIVTLVSDKNNVDVEFEL
ncbi:MAG TPA: condensation domain-containing protein, partial [Candidatus Kapabacteria bacterium]|nr:condensation domain-containing protein [Candidatus Kapabacteria bacterium]